MIKGRHFVLFLAISSCHSLQAETVNTVDLFKQHFKAERQDRAAIRNELLSRSDLIEVMERLYAEQQFEMDHVWFLEHVPYERCDAFLAKVSTSERRYLRSAVYSVLEKHGDCRGTALLRDALERCINEQDNDKPVFARDEIVDITEALAKIHCPESTRILWPLTDHPSPVVSCFAAAGLAERGELAIVPKLISQLSESDDVSGSMCGFGTIPVREVAAEALQQLTYQGYVDPWRFARHSENVWLSEHVGPETDKKERRSEAVARNAESLIELWEGWWAENEGIPRDELRDKAYVWATHAAEREEDRKRAFFRLALIVDEQAVTFLARYLERKDIETETKVLALHTFVNQHNVRNRTFPKLDELYLDLLVSHRIGDIRTLAAEGLRQYRTEEVREALIEALADEVAAPEALNSLMRCNKPADPEVLIPFMTAGDDRVRENAVRQLNMTDFVGQESLYLERLAVETDNNVRRALVNGLGRFGTYDSVPQLLELLTDEKKYLRSRVASALENIAGQKFRFNGWDDELNQADLQQIHDWWAEQ